MKACIFYQYGTPQVLQIKEFKIPVPKDNEVLVQIHASSINDWDWGLLRGQPFVNRLLFGLQKPKINILGIDISGKVVSVGKNVTLLKLGDDVFGDLSACGFGGFAEYVCVPESALEKKPTQMTYHEAAAVPHAAALALQGLFDINPLVEGQKILINGAGGGAGTLAIQIAKLYGAEVTAVDSSDKLEFLKSLGADILIDYTKEDFTKSGISYDRIIDNAAWHPLLNCKRALKKKGTYEMVGGGASQIFQTMVFGPILSLFSNKYLGILPHKPNKHLNLFCDFYESGKVKPIIDKIFPLYEVPKAFEHYASKRAKGRIVISVKNMV